MSISTYIILFGFLFGTASAAAAAASDDDQKVAVSSSTITIEEITPEMYKTFISSGQLELVQQRDNIYRPYDDPPRIPCLKAYDLWMAQHINEFQALANKECRPFRGGWSNKDCCVLFVVNPQYPPCRKWAQYEYSATMKVSAYASP
ncbi:hypothetical protein I4U23_005836 [Adineta vaga]|nr:hypothetical protein I4U23_005836 [Adineta vaga]